MSTGIIRLHSAIITVW